MLLGQILFFVLVGSLFSLVGGLVLTLAKRKFSHRVSLLFVSFAAGVLLATAIFDLLPESLALVEELLVKIDIWPFVFGGMFFLFVLEKFLLWYHHHGDDCSDTDKSTIPFLITAGDTLHNFVDGLVIAGTFLSNPGLGITTALAVAAHEIPHEMADFGVLMSKGWSKTKTIWVNIISSLASILGAVLVYMFKDQASTFLPYMLAFGGGMFIYLGASDLIPELHHRHPGERKSQLNSLLEIIVFMLGVGGVWGLIKLLEG